MCDEILKKKQITLSTGEVVEDWSTDWLDSTLSVLYLLYDVGNECYKASLNILHECEVIETFVVDSNRIDFEEIYNNVNICRTRQSAVKMFIKCCQHHNYMGYPFYYGIDKYLLGSVHSLGFPNIFELPNFNIILHWKRVDYMPECHNHEPLSKICKHQYETLASEWIKYRIIKHNNDCDIPECILHSLDNSLICSFTHCLVEGFYFAWCVNKNIREFTIKRAFEITRKYLNPNDLSRVDVNELTPLELFNLYFPFMINGYYTEQHVEHVEYRNLLTQNESL